MALIAPSILTADYLRLGEEIARIATADWLHLDVMDGHFVSNLTFGPAFCKAVTGATALPAECHLMVERPQDLLARYAEAGVRRLIVHPESTPHLHRLVQEIHALGCEAGAALNPGTPLSAMQEVAEDLDLLLVMTVNPGFGGQAFLASQLRKVRQAHAAFPDLAIEVDGGVNEDTGPLLVAAGASVLVAGSSVFGPGEDPAERIAALRRATSTSR